MKKNGKTLYVIQDNYAGGVVVFDNETAYKNFIQEWRQATKDEDGRFEDNFAAYRVPLINMSYYEYMDSESEQIL